MSKTSEALKTEPRQYSMSQALVNAINLITAARAKLVSNKATAVAELDAAAANLVKVARTLDPTFDFDLVEKVDIGDIVIGIGPDMEELLEKIRGLTAQLDTRNAELSDMRAEVSTQAARIEALVAKVDASSAASAPVTESESPPTADPVPAKRGGRGKRLSLPADEPEAT